MLDWDKLRADLSGRYRALDDAAALAAIRSEAAAVKTAPARDRADPEQIIAAFTPDEWAAAKERAKADAKVAWWFDRLMARNEPVAVGEGTTFRRGLDHLVGGGVLTAERAASISDALTVGESTELPFDVATYGEPVEAYHIKIARRGA